MGWHDSIYPARHWTKEDDALLREYAESGRYQDEAAEALGRSVNTITCRASRQGIKFTAKRSGGARNLIWTSAEDKILRAYAVMGFSFEDVAKATGKTRNSVAGRAHRLGVKFRGTMPEEARKRASETMKRHWRDPKFRKRWTEARWSAA